MKYISRKKSEVTRPYHILYHILTTTLHWIIRHNHQIKVLSKVINFIIRPKTPSRTGFSKTFIYWASKSCGILHKTKLDQCHLIFYHEMLFYHWKPSAQTGDQHSYGHRPSSMLEKPVSIFL